MRGRSFVVASLLVAGVAGCGSDGVPPVDPPPTRSAVPTTGAAPTTPAPDEDGVIHVALSGQEAYGLAVTADAVWVANYISGSLSRVDPVMNLEDLHVPVGGAAASLLTSADGGLWLASYGDGADARLSLIDQADASVEVEASPGALCCDLTELDGTIWGIDPRGSLFAADPETAEVVGRAEVPIDPDWHTNVVAAGGALWASSDPTELFRVDPESKEITDRLDVGGGVPFVADGDELWGARTDALWVVDARSGRKVREVPIEGAIEVLSVGLTSDEIWAGIRRAGAFGYLVRMDRETGEILDEYDVDVPARIAFGFDSVWVTDEGRNELLRIPL